MSTHTTPQRQPSRIPDRPVASDRSTFLPDCTSWLDVTQGDIDPAPQYLRVSNCGRVVDTWGVEV